MTAVIDFEPVSKAEWFLTLPAKKRKTFLDKLDDDELNSFLYDWDFWGRPEQQLPTGDDWRIFLMLAGRGGGKTRPASEIVNEMASNEGWHIALIGETAAEYRDVMVEGPSGILATAKPWNPAEWYPSMRRVVWPKTGTWATTYSGDRPDQLRGPNSHFAWIDELSKFRYAKETWDNLRFILRAGRHPKTIISTTPRPIPLIKELIKDAKDRPERVIIRRWATYRNASNLAPDYLEEMLHKYEGTRLGRQELYAEVLEDTDGALWTLRMIDANRVTFTPHMSVIAVGVDPPSSTGGTCGIVVMGLSGEDLYCLDDMSLTGVQPEEWGRQVVAAYHKHHADVVVPEKNQGGDMVLSTIRAIDPTVPMSPVWASRGKRTRAEPISTYTEKGAVHHIGAFPDLEDQMTTWVPGESDSPDRMDAYVWAATHLMEYTPYGAKSKQAKVLF